MGRSCTQLVRRLQPLASHPQCIIERSWRARGAYEAGMTENIAILQDASRLINREPPEKMGEATPVRAWQRTGTPYEWSFRVHGHICTTNAAVVPLCRATEPNMR